MNGGTALVVICCVFASVLEHATAQDARPFSSPRLEVVSRLQAHVIVALADRSATPEEIASTLAAVKSEIERNASDILTDPLMVSSQRILDLALAVPMNVKYRDAEYLRAAARLDLHSLLLRLKFLELFPPLSEKNAEVIRTSLNKARSEVQKKMEAELIPLNIDGLTKMCIENEVAEMLGPLADHVGSEPFHFQLMVALTDADIEALTADFAERLHESIPLIRNLVEERTRSLRPGQDKRAAITGVLRQILRPAQRSIADRSADLQRKSYDIRKVGPAGYQQAADDYAKSVQRLMSAPKPATLPTTSHYQ